MDYALEERIGNPDLFTGRNKKMEYFSQVSSVFQANVVSLCLSGKNFLKK